MDQAHRYQQVSFEETKTSSESEDAHLMETSPTPVRRRERVRTLWMSICAIVLLSSYTAVVVLLATKTVVDPTHGGKIIKCKCT